MNIKKKYTGILLIASTGEYILQRRENIPTITNPGKITTFGGNAIGNELPNECGIREIYEELNLKLNIHHLQFLLETDIIVKSSVVTSTIYFCRDVDVNSLILKEGEKIELINEDCLHQYIDDFSPLCTEVLKKYRSSII